MWEILQDIFKTLITSIAPAAGSLAGQALFGGVSQGNQGAPSAGPPTPQAANIPSGVVGSGTPNRPMGGMFQGGYTGGPAPGAAPEPSGGGFASLGRGGIQTPPPPRGTV